MEAEMSKKAWWLRHPHTTQERRMNGHRCSNQEIPIRAKRGGAVLVEVWDDIVTGSQRSWKKHRKTQYKLR
jgi:hypothetical protein